MLRFLRVFLLAAVIALAGCGPLLQPEAARGERPTPIVVTEPAGEGNPSVFVDTSLFQKALVEALNARDSARLRGWMTEPFLTGWWRGELMDEPPVDALQALLNERMDAESQLALVPGADLYRLMGERSPLALPRPEAGVVSAFLVSGWGVDGRDEYVLFISRRPDNSLRWHGAMLVPGGFTAQQAGGVQQFTNRAHGYSLFIPSGFEVVQPNASQVIFLARGEGHRERGFISVEPANGRSAEEVAETVRAELPADLQVGTATVMGIEGEQAFILNRLPGQNLNRQVFLVHNDVLYQMMFVPEDEAAGEAYRQMEDLYATVINTFHFLSGRGQAAPLPITDLEKFEAQLRGVLARRDLRALRGLMGDSFTMAFWQSEGINIAPAQAAEQILLRFVPPGSPMVFENDKDFASVFGEASPVVVDDSAVETVIPVFVSSWGLEGKDEAVFYIAQRADGSLYWKGVLTAQGGFPRPQPTPEAVGGFPVTSTPVQYILARANLNMRGGPGTSYAVVGKLAEGMTAQVTGASTDGGWWRVICPDGTVGSCWVSADTRFSEPAAAPGS